MQPDAARARGRFENGNRFRARSSPRRTKTITARYFGEKKTEADPVK
jgi:hypothetical protein